MSRWPSPHVPAIALASVLAHAGGCYVGVDDDLRGDAASAAATGGTSGADAGTSSTTSASGGVSATAVTTTTSALTSEATSADATSTTTRGAWTSGEQDTSGEPEPALRYVGRHDASDPSQVVMGWSGVGVVFRLLGTGASVDLDDRGRYFTVVVDGVVQAPLATESGPHTYVVAAGLPYGEHTIELYRRTEGSFGRTVILGVTIEGELLAPPAVTRRIEVIGDSVSAGYGDEGVAPCSFSAETENHYVTYGAVAARLLGAELHTIAWSGKGLVYNFGDDKVEPMVEVYDRLAAVDGAAWGFAWQPDAVVINLGTNDFSTDDDPSEALFVSTYVEFLAHLRAVYPDALLLPIAPSLFGGDLSKAKGYIASAVAARQEAGDGAVAFADVNVEWLGVGCDGHPDAATHAAMGEALAAELAARLGW